VSQSQNMRVKNKTRADAMFYFFKNQGRHADYQVI
jgi:hypothetical protein